jgi:CheY-like chemotaxis protein
VRLPAHEGAKRPDDRGPAGAATDRCAASALAGVDVLLVDDDADTLLLFKTTLEAHGARVRPAATAPRALGIAAEWRPRLLVTRHRPARHRRLCAAPGDPREDRAPHLAAVAVTAFARPDDRARALAAGFQTPRLEAGRSVRAGAHAGGGAAETRRRGRVAEALLDSEMSDTPTPTLYVARRPGGARPPHHRFYDRVKDDALLAPVFAHMGATIRTTSRCSSPRCSAARPPTRSSTAATRTWCRGT